MNEQLAQMYQVIGDSFLKLSHIYASMEGETLPTSTRDKAKAKPITKEEVRALLVEKTRQDGGKYKELVKGLVAKYSPDGTLTNVPEDKYPDIMSELEVIDE